MADGRRGPQALSVRIIDTPRLARHTRPSADDMAIIVEDLVKVLDGVGGRLRGGRYPDRAQGKKLAALMRKIADDFDA